MSGGCTNCGAKAGCDHRKGSMLEVVEQVMSRLYPTRRWGEPDDDARFAAGIDDEDGQALADELARELDAATFFRRGGPDEYCDYIYVLCLGREPCLVQVRDGEVPVPAEIGEGALIREQYLRVCLSSMARVAGVQQTALELERLGDEAVIRESPRAGVYDAPLLRRFQRLVALLPAYDILHVDFGEISAPPEGFDPGDYAERYGVAAPHRANYLFYPQPTTTEVISVLPCVVPVLD
jgi:hypothetical protein